MQVAESPNLAEVLKWPFTVGEAEKIVLAELERQTGKPLVVMFGSSLSKHRTWAWKGLEAPAKQPHLGDKDSINVVCMVG